MFAEFKKFIMRGNALDLAVGVVIGAAFGSIVTSLVNDLIMPPLGLLLGSVDFKDLFVVLKEGATAAPYLTMAQAQEAGAVTWNYGAFVNTIVQFLIVGVAIFLVVRAMNRVQGPAVAPPSTTRGCPFCTSQVALAATRCPHCTSTLDAQ